MKQITFDGTNGTPDTSQGGIASVLYNARTNKFLISIPEVGSDVTAGAVAVMDPVTGNVTQVFSGLDNCMPSGMAQGPGENVLVTCDPGFPAPDPVQFAPRTYVINGSTGAILANLTQVGGVDYAAYNPIDHHYWLGARDFFTSPTATTASPVLGVIDARTNEWIENFPTGTNAIRRRSTPSITRYLCRSRIRIRFAERSPDVFRCLQTPTEETNGKRIRKKSRTCRAEEHTSALLGANGNPGLRDPGEFEELRGQFWFMQCSWFVVVVSSTLGLMSPADESASSFPPRPVPPKFL